jgi:hypothetical protein
MAAIYCQLMYSDTLAEKRGEAYWRALAATNLPVRPWEADSFESQGNVLREACDRGERTVIQFDDEEWIASVDWETGTLGVSGDANMQSTESVLRVRRLTESLFEILEPRFGWCDIDGAYPEGLVQDVLTTNIRWIFWLNYYGAPYISKYGADFFQSAPYREVAMIGNAAARCLTSDAPGADVQRLLALTTYFAASSITAIRYGREM